MMFSDHISVNLLTAALPALGVKDVVVCPGARNAPLTHNIHLMRRHLRAHEVTDERSAAFVALGMALRTGVPVAVCVTSGSALLNTLPAVAEAYMRHIPLLVISADRPSCLIGQLEGQTLQQQGALTPYAETFHLPEKADDIDGQWHLKQLFCQAYSALGRHGGSPVHINLPIPEPLFGFSSPCQPKVMLPKIVRKATSRPIPQDIMHLIAHGGIPLLVLGQRDFPASDTVCRIEQQGQMLVLPELIAGEAYSWRTLLLEEEPLAEGKYVIVHAGGNQIGKKLKQDFQNRRDVRVVRIEEGNGTPDTFRHLSAIVYGDTECALRQLADELPENAEVRRLQSLLTQQWNKRIQDESDLSPQERAFAALARAVEKDGRTGSLHLANSTPIRMARRFFDGGGILRIVCNRGTNGIEGSISTAVGYALAERAESLMRGCQPKKTLLVTGDLSFFYDANALWNKTLGGELRILLLNNGGGGIFHSLPGLKESPALKPIVAASHKTSAEGLCHSFGVAYSCTDCTSPHLETEIRALIADASKSPRLLEVNIPL